jgi:hypothetical protein
MFVAFHGNESIDDYTQSALDQGLAMDLRDDEDNGIQPRLTRKILHWALKHNLKYIGVLDDDAYIRSPEITIDRMRQSFDRGAGSTGPFDNYINWIKFNNAVEDPVYELPAHPWSTCGCQIYSVDALRQFKNQWSTMCLNSTWRVDYQFCLGVCLYGYRTYEFWSPGYDHKMSQGVGANYDESWFIRRLKGMAQEHQAAWDMFKEIPKGNLVDEFLIEQFVREFIRLNNLVLKSKVDTKNWSIQPIWHSYTVKYPVRVANEIMPVIYDKLGLELPH